MISGTLGTNHWRSVEECQGRRTFRGAYSASHILRILHTNVQSLGLSNE